MGTDGMMERITEASPRLEAKITVVLYVVTILTGIFAQAMLNSSATVTWSRSDCT
jgi:hypothetical protein